MSKRILLCEDEPEIRQIIETSLTRMGHSVDSVATADQAVELFCASVSLQKPYDLVLTDVDMPRHTGLYFASYIRAQGYQGRIAVLTNLPFRPIAQSVAAVGGEYYLKAEEINDLGLIVDGCATSEQKRRVGD